MDEEIIYLGEDHFSTLNTNICVQINCVIPALFFC